MIGEKGEWKRWNTQNSRKRENDGKKVSEKDGIHRTQEGKRLVKMGSEKGGIHITQERKWKGKRWVGQLNDWVMPVCFTSRIYRYFVVSTL